MTTPAPIDIAPSPWLAEPSWSVATTLEPPPPPYRTRYRLATVLLCLTFLTSTTLGAMLYLVTRTDETTSLPWLLAPETVRAVWTTPRLLRFGLSFSLPLLVILGSHELGHFLTCRRYRVPSTAPYFLPAPLGIGTFGAFIRIRARINSKRQLFDIGIAGPIAGFVALVPFLVLGVAWSTPAMVAMTPEPSAVLLYRPGTNLAIHLLTLVFHGRLPASVVLDFHPFALAAWVGMLATALNLLPMGQLDGGHILYSVAGHLHRRIAWATWLVACALGFWWLGWLLISLMVLLLMGLRHPPVVDADQPLDRRRRRLAAVALAIFVLCFTPIPMDILTVQDSPGVLVRAPIAALPARGNAPS
ncbi:MAG TPA: site-2 protease family protein [Thermoanaerobaculia bacterium]|nr:site-2 protease family protein [Thermoanaerobaculia bacterium]